VRRAWPIAAYYSNTLSMGIIPDLGYTTSAGGGSPLELLPDKEQGPAVCLEMRSVREYVLCRIGLACLGKIARVSGSPNSSEPAEKKRRVKLTHVCVDQPAFYITHNFNQERLNNNFSILCNRQTAAAICCHAFSNRSAPSASSERSYPTQSPSSHFANPPQAAIDPQSPCSHNPNGPS
jgi:hypothetical protein